MLSSPSDAHELPNPSEDRSATVVALWAATRFDISVQSARDQKGQGAVYVAGWGTAMAEADEISTRLRGIEETVDLMRAALPREKAASERLDAIEKTLQGLQAEIETLGSRTRFDWELLSAAVRRADVLKTMEETAFTRIANLEKRHAALDGWVNSLWVRSQLWGAVFFVMLAAGIVAGAR
jgi:hypothetical protein